MNEKSLLTLKQIADEIGVNYKTLLSCKARLGDYIHGVPVGRVAKYSKDNVDFFRMVFALFDEGYSTEQVRNLLLNGVECEEDAFIESWLEEWRSRLGLGNSTYGCDTGRSEGEQEQTDGLTDGMTNRLIDSPTDRLTGRPADGLTDLPTDSLTDGRTDPPTDSPTHGLTDGPADGMTDGRTDPPTDSPADGPTHGLTDPPADRLTGPPADALTDSPTDRPTDGMTDRLTDKFQIMHDQAQQTIALNLQTFIQSLTHTLQKMATQSNIAITALCEATDDIHTAVLNLDTRLSHMEKDLDMKEADPLELYQVEAGNYQVDLPEISLPVFKDQNQDQDQGQVPEDDLSPVRDSITNGIPDKEMLVEWIITRREEDLQANSYSVLAAALNEGEIPTLTGRANWSKGTIRNLVVRKKAEQD
jgi:hypothetical protein